MNVQGLRQRSTKQDAKKSVDEKEQDDIDNTVLWTWIILFRIVNSLVVYTFFNPDEYWQSLEVAHNMVFKYGYLTWEWKEALRSYLHPLIFALLYQVLSILHLDYPFAVIYAPRILQGTFAAIGDICIIKMSSLIFQRLPVKYVVSMLLLNWFMFYCIVRTYSNSLETVLVCVALYLNTTKGRIGSSNVSHGARFSCYLIAGICFVIRPTSAVIFGTLALYQFFVLRTEQKLQFILDAIFIGTMCIGAMLAIDSYFYGRFVIVPWNFVKFNLLKDVASIYGTHPWHWYLTQGFPAILGPAMPFCLYGLHACWRRHYFQHAEVSVLLIVVYTIVFSKLAHKEFRFMLPLLPLMLLYGAYGLNEAYQTFKQKTLAWKFCIGLLLLNIPMALYFSQVHQRGVISVMSFLQTLDEDQSVHFLMPCHATPFYSHVHKNISMDFWDCTPRDEPGYVDDSDKFKMNPWEFTREYYFGNSTTPIRKLPSHFVLYEDYLPKLQSFFDTVPYEQVASYFHAFNGPYQDRVIVLQKKEP